MSKKLKNLKWNTVALEGFPVSVTENLQGFVGLEECTTYGLDKESKRPKKVFLFFNVFISNVGFLRVVIFISVLFTMIYLV